jgi:hypothetical protein
MEVSTGDTASVFRKGHRESGMSKVFASITTSIDGYVFGPGKGLGEGGERLHYWVFGGPWSYDEEPPVMPGLVEQEWFDSLVGRMGSAVAGRNMYEAGSHRGDTNPWGVTCFHRHPPRRRPSAGLWSPRATVPVG